jgi:hypothetical protein
VLDDDDDDDDNKNNTAVKLRCKKKLCVLSPRADYTDQVTAAYRRSYDVNNNEMSFGIMENVSSFRDETSSP